jgi:hypothetical protein
MNGRIRVTATPRSKKELIFGGYLLFEALHILAGKADPKGIQHCAPLMSCTQTMSS